MNTYDSGFSETGCVTISMSTGHLVQESLSEERNVIKIDYLFLSSIILNCGISQHFPRSCNADLLTNACQRI